MGIASLIIGILALLIGFDVDLGVATVEPVDEPNRLTVIRYAFWFAWFSIEGTVPVMIPGAG